MVLSPVKATHEALIIRVAADQVADVVDQIASETTFSLLVNGHFLVSLLCSPLELDAMAIGFLLSEGLLQERESLQSVSVDESTAVVEVVISGLADNWQNGFKKRTITSGCGKGVTFTDSRQLDAIPRLHAGPVIGIDSIRALMKEFARISGLFQQTGGVHSAALADGEEILFFSEDIGRHNAVDKLIGKAFLRNTGLADKILLSSGRISGEIMGKVVRNGIPVLISRAAPTCLSLTLAEDHGVTLIGFARGVKMNIYTHPQRISIDKSIRQESETQGIDE